MGIGGSSLQDEGSCADMFTVTVSLIDTQKCSTFSAVLMDAICRRDFFPGQPQSERARHMWRQRRTAQY